MWATALLVCEVMSTIEVQIAACVLEAWLDGKSGLAADEIATAIGAPVGKVRRAISDAHGAVPGTSYFKGERPTFSRNYPDMQVGFKAVGMYRPDDDAIRCEVKRLRELTLNTNR